ncbi:MAG: hypothetical protein ACPW61_05855 [Methyloligella sp. ZOD6]
MRKLLLFVAPLALAISSLSATAASGIEGTWSGSGTANPKNGKAESIRCKVTYRRESPKVVGVNALCATSSNKFRQTGSLLQVNDSRYVGDFHNAQFDVSGRLTVTVRGGSQSVSFSSPRGTGSMNLRKQ